MKTAALLAAASILIASAAIGSTSVSAQSAAPPVLTNAPLPPGINQPGVKAVLPKVTTSASGAKRPALDDSDSANDGKRMTLPDVIRHQEGDNQVEEYRRSGMLYMVVVTPRNGIPQSYAVDPDGTRHMQTGQPPVHPAMYKVLEWGKSKPAEAGSSGEP